MQHNRFTHEVHIAMWKRNVFFFSVFSSCVSGSAQHRCMWLWKIIGESTFQVLHFKLFSKSSADYTWLVFIKTFYSVRRRKNLIHQTFLLRSLFWSFDRIQLWSKEIFKCWSKLDSTRAEFHLIDIV